MAGRLHDDLKEQLLHVDQQVTSLVEWSTDITTNLNDIEARVDNLEQWVRRARSELVRFNRQARAG